MKIQCFSQNNYKPTCQPNFTANSRAIWMKTSSGAQQIRSRNTTFFFRDDLKWQAYVDMLIKKYEHAKKVMVYCAGCSSGEEPFSLAMLLIEKLGKEKAQKFFPILATDFDSVILKNPKRGLIKPSEDDIDKFETILGSNSAQYITYNGKYRWNKKLEEEVCDGKINPILKGTVVFKKANFKDVIPTIEPNNSVVMCRNFWYYVQPQENRTTLVRNLFNQLGDNSLCVIGDYEKERKLDTIFTKVGFFQTNIPFVLHKGKLKK